MGKELDLAQAWVKEFADRLKVDLSLMLIYSQDNISQVIDELTEEVLRDIKDSNIEILDKSAIDVHIDARKLVEHFGYWKLGF